VLQREGVTISMDGRGRAFDNIFVERLWRSVKHEDVYLYGYATMGELLIGLAKYFVFYNEERPHQSLSNAVPTTVYETGVGGGAMIVNKFGKPADFPIALRSTGTESEENPIEKESDTESQNPGQRRPAACEIESSLN